MSFDMSVFAAAQAEGAVRSKAKGERSVPITTRCTPADQAKLCEKIVKAYPHLVPAPELVKSAGRTLAGPIAAAAFRGGNQNVILYNPKQGKDEGSVVWTNLQPL